MACKYADLDCSGSDCDGFDLTCDSYVPEYVEPEWNDGLRTDLTKEELQELNDTLNPDAFDSNPMDPNNL